MGYEGFCGQQVWRTGNRRSSVNRRQQGSLVSATEGGRSSKCKRGRTLRDQLAPLSDAVGLSSVYVLGLLWPAWWTLAAGGYKHQIRGWGFGANWSVAAAAACILNEAEGF